jgi:spore germination protein GerM
VYLVRDDRLVAADRVVVGTNVPAEAIRSLLRGPTPDESVAGITTAVPPSTRMLSLDVSDGVATVDLSAEFGTSNGDNQVVAVAQIVFTVTASPYVRAALFSVDGRPIQVPDDTGSLSSVPRSRAEYERLSPR